MENTQQTDWRNLSREEKGKLIFEDGRIAKKNDFWIVGSQTSFKVEYKGGKSKNSYATDHKPRDMIYCKNHFFIWCLIDDDDKPHFLVMSVKDFIKTMGNSMRGTSFLKDQDRQHFSSKDFGKWKEFLNRFDLLDKD